MLRMENGKLVAKSLLENFTYRGIECEHMNMIEFAKDTYEMYMSKEDKKAFTEGKHPDNDQLDDRDHPEVRAARKRGRPRSERSRYLEGHTRRNHMIRVLRPDRHKMLLSIVGPYFPNAKDTRNYEFYCASMITLLKPWRRLSHIKPDDETWEEALNKLRSEGGEKIARYLSNIQYYYDSKAAAEKKREEERPGDSSKDDTNAGNDREKDHVDYDEINDNDMRLNLPIDEDVPVEGQ